MSVTASRLGSSPITLDWTNLASIPAGTGTAARPYQADAALFGDNWNKLKARFASGEVGFYDAPINDTISQASESIALAEKYLERNQFTDCLFLGIGGSALGPYSVLQALPEHAKSGIRFHFMENPDALDWDGTIKRLNPNTTLVAVVTKSGTTFETMALFLLAMEWLGSERRKTHIVAITDPVKGDLKKFAETQGIPTLHVHPSMGGRYSVFTPVGLFALALAGLSVMDFIQGAKQVRDFIEKTPHEKNPIFILSDLLLRHAAKRNIHVCMPYSTRLKSMGSWYVQLWAESLGKDGKGFTPLAAVGATDQHSLLQLLRDGTDDKVTHFLTIDQMGEECLIPRAPVSPGQATLPAFKLLEGHSLQELLSVEYQATSRVLTKQGRPNVTWRLDRLDEKTIGALYFSLCALTAFTGTLMGINAFDQPGVEEGKIYIREALSKGSERPAEEDENSPVNRLRRSQS